MKTVKYNPRKDEYVAEDGEIFRGVGTRSQELLDLSVKWKMLFQDCLGEFVIIKGRHYRVIKE
jgi:hypothetical protein